MTAVRFFWRVARKTGTTGFAVGTLYFIVIGAVTFFGGVLTAAVAPLLWFVLFVGAGAALGLVFGLVVAAVMTVTLPRVSGAGGDQERRLRLAGAAAAGIPVFVLTMTEQLTNVVGLLSPDLTTVVVIPTAVAIGAGAASAPGLCARNQPKRPET